MDRIEYDGSVGVIINDLDLSGNGVRRRSNWFFEYDNLPEGVTVQLTPSNDVNQVIKDSKVIAVFSKDDSYSLQKFLKKMKGDSI